MTAIKPVEMNFSKTLKKLWKSFQVEIESIENSSFQEYLLAQNSKVHH